MSGSCWAIVLAAGKDQELSSGADTAFLGIGNRPALACVLSTLETCPSIEGVVAVVPRERLEMIGPLRFRFGINKIRECLAGVPRRIANLAKAWSRVEGMAEWVVILDVCRPMVTSAMVEDTLRAAARSGGAMTGRVVEDPVRVEVRKGEFQSVRARSVWAIQSPMAFRADVFSGILSAARKSRKDDAELADLAAAAGCEVRLVASPNMNLTLRTADDLAVATCLIGEKRM